MKNLKKLTRKDLVLIGGGDTAYGFCDESGYCPPTFPSSASTYCINGICYRTTSGGGPGTGCHEPQRFCQEWETGCGCVY
ncbi:hypothetical protein [Chryseobacterium sp. G0201]|uniref:hypothetical protein n=1 Tax=Chryseobacterium sp. G0201 TaxID=2487065 RepID=UPI000F4F657A|nr:hypothetical protein [Chryseobacterium sp. G0201]AZA51768.1 hypothetical protein EG348_01435 [Chryseobacterium sp. G0201]